MKCERKNCKRTAVAYVMGRWACAEHDRRVPGNCSHSMVYDGRCSFCGGRP